MNLNNSSALSCTGVVRMTVTDAVTGEEISSDSYVNTVTNEGLKNWVVLMVSGNTRISEISLGSDVGNGTKEDPQPASLSITSTSQNVVYTSPCERDIRSPYRFSISSFISGRDFMDDNPDVTGGFTSLCAKFSNGESFAYRRISEVLVTRLVDITIDWTFEFEWCEE